MAGIYIILGLGVVLINIKTIPHVFQMIFEGAFSPSAATGGVVGSMFLCMKKGVSRGIFSNEAGLGTGSISHASSDTDEPVKTGSIRYIRSIYRYYCYLYTYSSCYSMRS